METETAAGMRLAVYDTTSFWDVHPGAMYDTVAALTSVTNRPPFEVNTKSIAFTKVPQRVAAPSTFPSASRLTEYTCPRLMK